MMRLSLVCTATAVFAFCAISLPAQTEGPLQTEPHLSLAFPFEKRPEGIGIKCPVLINTTAVVPANAILRVIYVPPRGDDVEVKIEAAKGNSENSWTKNNRLSDDKPKLSPLQLAAKKIAEETVWPSVTMFQLAFANLNSQDLHLVYLNPENLKLTDEPINFPEGLVLADLNGAVTVLAVEKNSPSEQSGFKAGQQILKVGDTPMNGNLITFLDAYHAARKKAEDASMRALAMNVRDPDNGPERAL
jgi:hypothetical protein